MMRAQSSQPNSSRAIWAASILGQMVMLLLVCNAVLLGAGPATAGNGAPLVRIVAFGDSLTAGYRLPPEKAFPAQLQAALTKKGHNVEVINAGVSGDTTSGGRQRFEWAVPDGTDAVILELGANDALRGIEPKQTRLNLEAIIEKLKQRNISVLLAGMKAPSNWGEDYSLAFDEIFPQLAAQHSLLYYPFFLDGVALNPDLNLDDGLHPNAEGIAIIVERMLPQVEELIRRASALKKQVKS